MTTHPTPTPRGPGASALRDALLAKVTSDWDYDQYGEYEAAERRLRADLDAIIAAALNEGALIGANAARADAEPEDIRPCLDCGAPVRLTAYGGGHLDDRLDDTHTAHVARIQPARADAEPALTVDVKVHPGARCDRHPAGCSPTDRAALATGAPTEPLCSCGLPRASRVHMPDTMAYDHPFAGAPTDGDGSRCVAVIRTLGLSPAVCGRPEDNPLHHSAQHPDRHPFTPAPTPPPADGTKA